MAIDILAKYGIKEVADVVFYELSEAGLPEYPVLYLDTLKVSTIEQTAESSDARGGKGNAALISWDYGKEINVTLEDALFSAKSMAIMFGNGKVKSFDTKDSTGANKDDNYIMRTKQITYDGVKTGLTWESPEGKIVKMLNPRYFDANGIELKKVEVKEGTPEQVVGYKLYEEYTEESSQDNKEFKGRCFCTFDVAVSAAVIEISADSFPGTYYVTGDTYARSEASGKDEFFQFVIPKAKVQSENTITLEAEGDPSVFNMSLKVLRPADGKMMKLIKYNLLDEGSEVADIDIDLAHNHILVGKIIADAASNPDEQASG